MTRQTSTNFIGAVDLGSNNITNLANGVAATDAAAFGQIPTSLPPSGAAGGGLTGTYPNPTVATNANLTGPITSVGNTTSIASQTGTGTKFVVDTSPTLVTPNIGAATGSSLNLGTGSLNTVGNIEMDGTAARDVTVGAAASGAGAGLTISAGDAQTGSTDTAGGGLTLQTGRGTGSGAASRFIVNLVPAGSTGTTQESYQNGLIMLKNSTTGGLSIQMILNNSITGGVTGINLNGNNAETLQSVRHTTSNTAGTSLTVRSGGATSGATDKAAGDLILLPGLSTGTGGANVRIQTMTRALSTGTSDNTATDRIIAQSPKSVTNNSATTVASMTNANGGVVAGRLSYTVEVTDGTDFQYETGVISYGVTNKAGAIANNTVTKFGNQQAATAGTLTVTWTITAANPALIQVNVNSSLTPSTGYPRVTYVLENLTQQAVTIS